MKFLLIVLAIHLAVELIGNKKRNSKNADDERRDDAVRHPAEHELR